MKMWAEATPVAAGAEALGAFPTSPALASSVHTAWLPPAALRALSSSWAPFAIQVADQGINAPLEQSSTDDWQELVCKYPAPQPAG